MQHLVQWSKTRAGLVAIVVAAMTVSAVTAVYASHQFSDVASTSQFHDDIDAVADAGVTLGCTEDGTQYCPDEDVSRQQMAAFLNRLGALDPRQDPVVNARTVNGLGMFAGIVTVEVDNEEGNEEECEPTTSLLGTGHPFGTFFITYQLVSTPETIFTFDVNVAASDRNVPGETDETGEFLVCFATLDGRTLPSGSYELFAVEAHEQAPVSD